MNSETGGDPQTHSPDPSGESGRRRGAQRQGRRAGRERGARGEVRNPIGDSGLADAPIGVSLNMRAHKELNSQDSHRGATRALSEASSQENRIKANPKSRKNSSDH